MERMFSMHNISFDSHYIARLRDEYKVLSLAIKIQEYFNKKRQYAQASTLALLRLKYMYLFSIEMEVIELVIISLKRSIRPWLRMHI